MGILGKVAVLFALLLLGAAGFMAYLVMQRPRAIANVPNLLETPRHPVTEPMWKRSKAVAGKPAPDFELADSTGKQVRLSKVLVSGPAVLVFTKDGCPCSIEAQPFFNQIAGKMAGKVNFLGVIDSDKRVADKFKEDFKVPYPMLLAGDGAVFASYDAKRSVYVTLVARDGSVVKQWPGYSESMLKELVGVLESDSGVSPLEFTFEMAPKVMNSGCEFGE